MKQINTQAVVLNRTEYGEADRILTLLTPDHGKLSLIAKGVRKIKSKLAGGIELFSVSDISYIQGRGTVGTLVSTRLIRHYGAIVTDVNRTMLGYELIRQLHKATEDEPELEYFELIEQAFAALDDVSIDLHLIKMWFLMQLLRIDGHTPNLQTDSTGDKLRADQKYTFSYDDMGFAAQPDAQFGADHIKFLRVGFAGNKPAVIQKITGGPQLLADLTPLLQTMATTYIRL
ncbi:MAG TPA: DNA repair protein RecO [Candidatus Saccharimonadales bacterium]|jgi:DNA repair protein RecO (recombination protein O)